MKPENNNRAADIFKQIDHYNNLIELANDLTINFIGKGWAGCYHDFCKVYDLREETKRLSAKVIKKIKQNIVALENELKGL